MQKSAFEVQTVFTKGILFVCEKKHRLNIHSIEASESLSCYLEVGQEGTRLQEGLGGFVNSSKKMGVRVGLDGMQSWLVCRVD